MCAYIIKNLTHLYIEKVKFYSLFIFNQKKKCKDINILMFLTYHKIVYVLLKI